MALVRNFRLPEGIGVSADYVETYGVIQSTTPFVGSIVARGGAGIANSVSIGGRLQLFNSSNYTAFVSSASGNTVYTLPATSPAIGSSVLQSTSAGVMSWIPLTASGVVNVASSAGGTVLFIAGLNDDVASGLAVSSNANLTYNTTTNTLSSTLYSGTWAGTLITGLYGGTGFNSYTKGDLLVGAGTTLIKHAVGSQNQILIADLFSGSGLSWATFANPTYGSFYSTSTQQVAGAGVSTPVKFNATYESNRVSIFGGAGTSSRIQIQDAGPYSITFSAQINLVTGNSFSNGEFWFRINGQDVPQSNSSMSISGKDFETILTVNFVYTFANNDYFEIIMSSLDTQFSIEYQSGLTNPPRPNTPSIILSVLPITHIVGASGSGISGILSLNGSTVSQQYFLTGANGSDFNITTASGNHTFNIPIAGTGATGLLTSQAQTIGGAKTFTNDVFISSSTGSTWAANGALRIQGGLGVSGQLSLNQAALGFTGAVNPSIAFIGGTTGTPITMTVLSDNSLIFEGTSGKLFGINNNLSSGWIFNVGDISGLPLLRANADGTVAMAEFAGNVGIGLSNPAYKLHVNSSVGFTASTASTNTTTGALIVTGGVGIGQSVSVGGRLQLFNSANFTAFVSSATGNTVYTLPATSPATGSSVLQSTAAGVMSWVPMTGSGNTAQNIVVNTAGNVNVFHPILFTPSSLSAGSAVSSDSTISFNPSTEILHVSGLAVTSTTSSTSSSTGALVVSGGMGVSGDVFVAANAGSKLSVMQSDGDEGGEIFLNKPATNSTITNGVTIDIFRNRLRFFEQGGSARGFYLDITSGGNSVGTNIMGGASSGTVNSGTANYAAFYPASSNAVSENANLQFTGTGLSIGGNIPATSTTSGSLRVNGGVGITGSFYAAEAINLGTNTFTKNYAGDINLDNGTADTPGVRYYWQNNRNFGHDVYYSGSGSTRWRVVRELGESGGAELFSIDREGTVYINNPGSGVVALRHTGSGSAFYTFPNTAPATGTSYLTSDSSGVMSWIRPKRSYVLSFGAGFTPSANAADSIQLNIPYAPDNVALNYIVKRVEYRNETVSGGTGLSFYIERHTGGDALWSTAHRIHAGSGASFQVGALVNQISFTTINSSAGTNGLVASGDYVRLYFTTVGSAANVSISLTIEEQ